MSAIEIFAAFFGIGLAFFLAVVLFACIEYKKDSAPAPAEPSERDLGRRIDDTLDIYATLIENDCEETLILEIARDRVEAARRELEDFKLRKFESAVMK